MLTTDQSNYLHTAMRTMEEDAKRVLGLDVHFGVYMRSKSMDRMIGHTEAIEKMAQALSITLEELRCESRKADLVMARKVIVSVLRSCFPKITLVEMGTHLCRDHTSIMNLLSRATDYTNTNDEEFVHLFELAKKSLEI